MTGRGLLLARVRAEVVLLLVCCLLLVVSAVAVAALVSLDVTTREEGLPARWRSLPPEQRAVEVSTTAEEVVPPAGPADGTADAALRGDVAASIEPSQTPTRVLSAARTGQLDVVSPRVEEAASVVLMAFDDLPAVATLVDGRWPDPSAGTGSATPGDPAPATFQADAAAALGVGIGDTVSVLVAEDEPSEFEVVGTWRIGDSAGVDGSPSGTAGFGSASVAGSTLEVTGRLSRSAIGPLVPADPTALGPARRVWRVVPEVEQLTASGVRALPGALARMEGRIRADPRLTNPSVDDEMREGLPHLSDHVEGAGAVSRVALLLVAAVAVTTLLLTSRLLVQRRAGQTALARARGAAWRQVTGWPPSRVCRPRCPALPTCGAWSPRSTNTEPATASP